MVTYRDIAPFKVACTDLHKQKEVRRGWHAISVIIQCLIISALLLYISYLDSLVGKQRLSKEVRYGRFKPFDQHLLVCWGLLNGLNSGLVSLAQLIENMVVDRLVEDIDLCGSELSSADTLLEQNTQLSKGSAIGLGKAEVGVDDAEEADATLLSMLVWGSSERIASRLTQKKPV